VEGRGPTVTRRSAPPVGARDVQAALARAGCPLRVQIGLAAGPVLAGSVGYSRFRAMVCPLPPPTHTHSHTCLHTHTHARTHAHKQTPIRTRAHIFFFRETVSVNLLFSGQIFTSHAHSCTPINCRHTNILIISTLNKERGRSQAGC